VAELSVEFAAFTAPFHFQRVHADAQRMRRLGMSYRAIGLALGVNETVVRTALP
jgi:hypothetical protein